MKRKRNRSTKHGFTILEVVLVLAIAGLIFAMVFIAFPALQRSQRNNQRKRDAALIASAMNTWYTHNKVSVTDNYSKLNAENGFCTFYKRYVGEETVDPSTGEPYKVALWGSTFVVDCISGKTYNRKEFDLDVHGSQSGQGSDNWAKMEPGDIQYDDGAICTDEAFNDDIGNNRYSGVKMFAIRMRLEGGGTLCVDNGYEINK